MPPTVPPQRCGGFVLINETAVFFFDSRGTR